ncbi:excalibur calcium-binding domain-containing protein [Aeromicrobium sp. CnD17-E]|uniref:excalibur calcium-binding domain-containing protein n=1 Tax=Aeromicrobium sp. CnD17-E TaxID=2954487 RepID=UPI002096F553|nr:excalibur calcium-binding domain-containing protein [Aeromicrobium sp. CnD17-E]MCO7237915.1 excalibur calcium-binding domain-containing protein [Aeromicrobium sp. CnD17-E]
MRRRGSAVVLTMAVAFGTVGVTAVPAEAAKTYKNCTALHKDYKHGVGLPGAKDKTSGTPVTNFTKNKAVYNANTKSDRDKDGIACEKR